MSWKRLNCQRGPQKDPRVGDHEAGTVFHQAAENMWQDIVEEQAQ
jgi:hypothetical protein